MGGGLFGCYAALVLADQGHEVVLIEQSGEFLTRASLVNQARLHTGLHYPRSLLTATEALAHYRTFRRRWPHVVRDFTQIYAVARFNSKTTGEDFAQFIARLGLGVDEIDPDRWFHPATVSRAFRVEEPTFDAIALRRSLVQELSQRPNVTVRLDTAVVGGRVDPDRVVVELRSGERVETEGLVLAVYAGTNALRLAFGLTRLPLSFELAEVILGRVGPGLANIGFTVMDGPFWSLMPFGCGDQVSLTTVGLTPLRRASGEATFACQSERHDCRPAQLQDCTICHVRPPTALVHHQQQMARFLTKATEFTATDSLLTVKAILTESEVDDARPTLVRKEPHANVVTVFSGKVSTLFALEKELA